MHPQETHHQRMHVREASEPLYSLISPSPSNTGYPSSTGHLSPRTPTESFIPQIPFLKHPSSNIRLKSKSFPSSPRPSTSPSFVKVQAHNQLSPLLAISGPSDHSSSMKVDHFIASHDAGFCDYDNASSTLTAPFNPPSNFIRCPSKGFRSPFNLSINLNAGFYSSRFPPGHELNPYFAHTYKLEDELGSGGYGFVMTARHRFESYEVAVKFIIKDKVPEHAWMENEIIGRLPTEVMLLSIIDHPNIVKCLDLFEDSLYFYLVQELHGSPWLKAKRNEAISYASPVLSTPTLSPSGSTSSLASSMKSGSPQLPASPDECLEGSYNLYYSRAISHEMLPMVPTAVRPHFTRRPSYDLFECIEQSEHKRLSEDQARHVFSQVVDAVDYLDKQGVTHRDIKDENLVIDEDLNVKLIDFGSAAVVNPKEPRPYYTLFFGTTAYASSEILLRKDYQAPPAEIWTLGVLLSYLLTGISPFPTVKDAINGRIVLADVPGARLSRASMNLMRQCLDPNPKTRATISEVKAHPWLVSKQL